MSEKMYPIPFRSLMNWVVTEYADCGEIFGIHKAYRASGKSLPIFGERIETPFGPAAGPNSQLAQNIIAAYVAGARFFEVKTVQKMDGADLAACVPRPCILANDEGYNQEWSTELTVPQAMDEYIKAWCALKVLSKVYDLGDPDGFVFNMSVGYDLEGIKGEKVNTYIDGMMDARRTAIFGECKAVLKELFPAESDFIDAISPRVSGSVTVSTLHGCPPDEIERIASYLISEKHLHTFVKCNPTILGYETARRTLDAMGYDYIVFDEHHFNEDLQWADAVPMFQRLQKLADSCGLEFGLKLSNTFPVDTTRGELPNNEMYMSGRSLFPLTIEMCHRISRQFGGRMRISFAGGAEYFNCDKLFAAGIWPITVATTILKPGGYNRLHQMVEKTEKLPYKAFCGTDSSAISDMSTASHTDFHHVKPIKPLPSRKSDKQVPWLDCFTAPCKGGCPIEQDIPEYVELVRKGLYGPAGTGLLIVNCDLLPASLLEGGTGSFSMEAQMPDFLPDLLEAGTVNTPGILGLGAGIGFVLQHTPARLYRREMDLCAYLYRGLSRIDGVKLYSPPPRMGKSLPLIALNIGTLDSTRAAELLNEHHIAVRAGFHCAALAHRKWHTDRDGVVRVSLGAFNTPEQAQAFCAAAQEILRRTRGKKS